MVQWRFFDFQKLCNHAAMMVLGLFAGGVLTAAWFGIGPGSQQWGTQVQATATHGEGNFAIATGFVDNEVEAFYFLDFLTGDLRAAVVSRRTGDFVAFYERNIVEDFGGTSKNAKYLMVTGQARIPIRGRGNVEIGNSLIYIAEASSGEVAAYALPWNASLSAKGLAQRGNFVPLAKGSFRTTFVRDE